MAVDISPFLKTVERLAAGLARYRTDENDSHLRDGLIQQFEFTYDVAHKTLRRVLEARAADPAEIDRMSFPTLIRTAFEQGLLEEGWPKWQDFRENRNITSHTYDEDLARKVANAIPRFLDEVRDLADKLSCEGSQT